MKLSINYFWKAFITKKKKGIISKKYIARFIPPNPVIIEAGAHVGMDTLEMAQLWPGGEIHAFEPIPELFERLFEKTRNFNNVHCYKLALSNFTGRSKMYVSSGASNSSSSLLFPKDHLIVHPDVQFKETIDVDVTTIDDFLLRKRIKRVDFLWLDIQGSELAAMKASPRALMSVCAIHTEVSLKEVYENVPLYEETRTWLNDNGFRVVIEALPWSDMGNVLFVRSKI